MIINPNATIVLSARLPSSPDEAATVALPLDIKAQGLPPVDTAYLAAIAWVLMHNVVGLQQRVDRLERLVSSLVAPPRDTDGIQMAAMEDFAAGQALAAEVRLRRAAEAKAREEQAKAGGVQ